MLKVLKMLKMLKVLKVLKITKVSKVVMMTLVETSIQRRGELKDSIYFLSNTEPGTVSV